MDFAWTCRFKELEDCAEEVELKHLLRKSLQDWEVHTEAWLSAPLFAIQPSSMEEVVNEFNKVAYRVERGLPSAKVRRPSPPIIYTDPQCMRMPFLHTCLGNSISCISFVHVA